MIAINIINIITLPLISALAVIMQHGDIFW